MGFGGLVDLDSLVVGTKGAKGLRHTADGPTNVCVCPDPRHCSVGCIVLFRGAYGIVVFSCKVDGVDVDRAYRSVVCTP